MATSKEYAYQIKGNKLSLVEKDFTTSDGMNYTYSDRAGLNESSGSTIIKSPLTSVSGGIEIEYAYSPNYIIDANPTINVNKFSINGWIVEDGYLTFVRTDSAAGNTNWTSSPYNVVTSGASGRTGGQNLDYILVEGSSSGWDGLHRVQTAGTKGTLKTYTQVAESLTYLTDKIVDFNASEEFFDGGSGVRWAEYFSAGDYIWIGGGTEDPENQGMYRVASVAKSITDTSSIVTVDNSYTSWGQYETDSSGLYSERLIEATFQAADGSAQGVTSDIYKANRDFCHIYTNVNTLNDESDTIDVPSYLSKALVYYVKAKVAEDQMNIEVKEYMMREFRRMVEKHESSKIAGPRRIMPGSHAIR
jgi:hypothetical protein